MASNPKNRSFFKPTTYEEFRNFLKVNFYYCSLSQEQQSKYINIESLGTTRYNEYKNIVEKISEGKISFPKYNKKKSFKYDITQSESDYNALANSFQLKNITALEMCLTLFILLLLVNKPMTLSEIIDISGAPTENRTIASKVKTMHEYGLISKNENKYFIEENCFYSIDESLLLKLLNMADFMKNLIYPEVSGYNLYNLLKKIYEERIEKEYYSPFQFKYSHLANILDDNVLWSLIEAIENRQYISFTYGKKQKKNKDNKEKIEYKIKKKKNIIPVKIFTENEYNRRYLFAVTPEPFSFHIFRLSEIYDLKVAAGKEAVTKEKFENYLENYQSKKRYSFAGKIDTSTEAETETIQIKFKNSRKGREQLKKDFNCLKFAKDNTAEVIIKGKKMIKPYLRANMDIMKTTDKELSGLIESEIEEMKRNYGVIS